MFRPAMGFRYKHRQLVLPGVDGGAETKSAATADVQPVRFEKRVKRKLHGVAGAACGYRS